MFLSAYEIERAQNIARNNEFLASLGLLAPVQPPDPPKKNHTSKAGVSVVLRVQPPRQTKTAARKNFHLQKKRRKLE